MREALKNKHRLTWKIRFWNCDSFAGEKHLPLTSNKSFGIVLAFLEEIMIGVAATRRLADFTIPMELRIVALEGPEPIRSQQ